jgi:aerobic-type carbon monoxide dehydrogenase small subunit (CoxS/CutS family)
MSDETSVQIHVRVNGRMESGRAEPRMLLSDFLRDALGVTGVHVGCEHGVCGACTILLNGAMARSCLMFAVQADGAEITTIEGVSNGKTLHPVQEAFRVNHGLQCGFCTPGMVLTAIDLLQRYPNPDESRVREELSGNLCRCTGYEGIVAAVLDAAKKINLTKLQNKA